MSGSITEISKVVFNPDLAATPPAEFKYGWCKTDLKDGKGLYRDDFMKKEPYSSFIQKVLSDLGLPQPKKEEIYRGRQHDMLFLDSHGVVLRIGPTDVPDLINPAIVQPLGWVTDKNNTIRMSGKDVPLTVAIYPGIELYRNFKGTPETKLLDFLEATGQDTCDIHSDNKGIIRVLDDDGREVAVEMLLDADNGCNSSSDEASAKRNAALSSAGEETKDFSEVILKTIVNIFNAAKDAKWYQKAYEAHEPLRRLFWEAYKGKAEGEKPEAEAMKHFWSTCARVTNNPGACIMPVWKAVENDGQTEFVREEVYMPHVVLYRPWTGKDADKVIKPINQSKEVAEAVQAAHEKEIEQSAASPQQADREDVTPTVFMKVEKRQNLLMFCKKFFRLGG